MTNATALDSRIGLLADGRCYAYANGYDAEPTTGTREQVEIALGLRAAPQAGKQDRAYLVTVTPAVVLYAGTWAGGEYTAEIMAANASAAKTKARRARIAEDGRYQPRATYRARLK